MVILSLASGTGTSGGSVSLDLSIGGTGGDQCADVQWEFSLPAWVTLNTVTLGAVAIAASKSLSQAGSLSIVYADDNQNVIGNGVLVTATFDIGPFASGSFVVGLSNIAASDPSANALTTSGSPGTITVAGGSTGVGRSAVSSIYPAFNARISAQRAFNASVRAA